MVQSSNLRGRDVEESLTGRRVRLRPIHRRDLPCLQAWDEDAEIVSLMGRRFRGLEGGLDDWFRRTLSDRSTRAFAIEVRGQLIGEIELDHIQWRRGTAEMRVVIGEKAYWGQGYGADAVQILLRFAFGSLGLSSVYLRVYQDNRRAVRLYHRCGFRPQGILYPSRRRPERRPVLLMELTRDRFRCGEEDLGAGSA